MAILKNDWYTIQSGDTLSKIAKDSGISDWKIIYNDPQNDAFRKKRPDPNLIYPGDKIWIPGNPKTSTGKKTVFVVKQVIQASILQIEGDTDIAVAYAKIKVMKPHWKEGEAVEDKYTDGGASIDCSKKPMTFSLKEKTAQLKVKLKVDKIATPGDYTLTGTLNGLQFEATFKGEVGEKEIITKVAICPTVQKWYKGDMQWELNPASNPSQKTALSPTRLEMFFILDKPEPPYQANGVWIEVLRFLFDKAGLDGTSTDSEAAAKVSEYIHSKHGLKYNTGEADPANAGGSKFTTINWASSSVDKFKLMAYIKKTSGNIVNCYDQATAVQALCFAVGITSQWLFCDPFGFIKTTNLIGVGSCNNPFYPTNGSTKIVSQFDPNRTAFGNHAFCGLLSNVLDGCAGPHTGTETRADYLDNSIDRAMGFDGHVADIVTFTKVNSVE